MVVANLQLHLSTDRAQYALNDAINYAQKGA